MPFGVLEGNFRISKNKVTSIWNFVRDSGVKVFAAARLASQKLRPDPHTQGGTLGESYFGIPVSRIAADLFLTSCSNTDFGYDGCINLLRSIV